MPIHHQHGLEKKFLTKFLEPLEEIDQSVCSDSYEPRGKNLKSPGRKGKKMKLHVSSCSPSKKGQKRSKPKKSTIPNIAKISKVDRLDVKRKSVRTFSGTAAMSNHNVATSNNLKPIRGSINTLARSLAHSHKSKLMQQSKRSISPRKSTHFGIPIVLNQSTPLGGFEQRIEYNNQIDKMILKRDNGHSPANNIKLGADQVLDSFNKHLRTAKKKELEVSGHLLDLLVDKRLPGKGFGLMTIGLAPLGDSSHNDIRSGRNLNKSFYFGEKPDHGHFDRGTRRASIKSAGNDGRDSSKVWRILAEF